MNPDNIKLSVIMPVHNEQDYIAFALESVLSQTVNFPFEIIVVDDFSQDKTVDIIREYQQRHHHWRQLVQMLLLLNLHCQGFD